jgi:hypothetical protein
MLTSCVFREQPINVLRPYWKASWIKRDFPAGSAAYLITLS